MQDLTSVRNVFGAQMTDGETGVHKEVDGAKQNHRTKSYLF
jgi:hypothetical protein